MAGRNRRSPEHLRKLRETTKLLMSLSVKLRLGPKSRAPDHRRAASAGSPSPPSYPCSFAPYPLLGAEDPALHDDRRSRARGGRSARLLNRALIVGLKPRAQGRREKTARYAGGRTVGLRPRTSPAIRARSIALVLKPWQDPPCYGHLGNDAGAADLLKQMLAHGLSRYEPEPAGALAAIEAVSSNDEPPRAA